MYFVDLAITILNCARVLYILYLFVWFCSFILLPILIFLWMLSPLMERILLIILASEIRSYLHCGPFKLAKLNTVELMHAKFHSPACYEYACQGFYQFARPATHWARSSFLAIKRILVYIIHSAYRLLIFKIKWICFTIKLVVPWKKLRTLSYQFAKTSILTIFAKVSMLKIS